MKLRFSCSVALGVLLLSCGQNPKEGDTGSSSTETYAGQLPGDGVTEKASESTGNPSKIDTKIENSSVGELDIDLKDFKPLLQMQYGLNSEEVDQLIVFSEQKAALSREGLLDAPEGEAYWAAVDEFLTQLDVARRSGESTIAELRGTIFGMPEESSGTGSDSMRIKFRSIPKEHLRADGMVAPSFIEQELRKEEFWLLVEKTMVDRQMTFNPDAVDDETLARVFEVTKEEVEILKATPAFARPLKGSEAAAIVEKPLSDAIESHLQSGGASKGFKKHVARLEERRLINAKKFVKKAERAEKNFYELNPSWYTEHDELSDTYLSDNGTYVFLPLGRLSFADQVISHDTGVNAGGANARDALGEPNFDENTQTNMSNLGLKGILVLEFIDNVLIDVNGPDLFVFEIGAVEATRLEISTDGTNWIDVGEIQGGTAQVDIASFVERGQSFNYVRFTDLETFSALPGADVDAVATIGGALRLSLDSAVLFATGEHELKPEGVAAIRQLASEMSSIPKGTITVEGHTDDVGSEKSNRELSERRAASVAAQLRKEISGKWFKWKEVGRGESSPLVPNDSDKNRQKNRRVEILVTPF